MKIIFLKLFSMWPNINSSMQKLVYLFISLNVILQSHYERVLSVLGIKVLITLPENVPVLL